MEFERALFRVYDRGLEPLRHNNPILSGRDFSRPRTICSCVQGCILAIALVILLCTAVLHHAYAGRAGPCLQHAVEYTAEQAGVLLPPLPPANSTEPSSNSTDSGNSTAAADAAQYIELASGSRLSVDVSLALSLGSSTPEDYAAAVQSGAVNASDFTPDYTFAFSPAVLLLPDAARRSHNFTVLNVSLESHACFGASRLGSQLLRKAVGYDTALINQLMYSFHSRGMLLRGSASSSSSEAEEWWWGKSSIPPKGGYNWIDTLLLKLLAVVRAVLAFVVMSTITALVVRTLLSSGVAIMFPMLACLQRMGVSDLDTRILSLSYPWLGLPIASLQRRGQSTRTFLCGHLMQVIVYYTMYNACQLAWTMWLYDKGMSTALEVWLFGIVLLWEYYSLLFVRSAAATVFFPRLTALYFISFHIYYYYYPRAYFGPAATVMFLLLLHAMLWSVTALEVPALARGEVSFEHPRACYVELPWPAWAAALPPSWTLFVAPNARVRGVYDSLPERETDNQQQQQQQHDEVDDDSAAAGAEELRPLRRRAASTSTSASTASAANTSGVHRGNGGSSSGVAEEVIDLEAGGGS